LRPRRPSRHALHRDGETGSLLHAARARARMKIVRFKAAGKVRYGVIEGTHVVEYAGTPFGGFRRGRKRYPLRQTVLLVPVVPSKIVAVGLNYRDHAEEMHLPIPAETRVCFQPPAALCAP